MVEITHVYPGATYVHVRLLVFFGLMDVAFRSEGTELPFVASSFNKLQHSLLAEKRWAHFV